MILFNDSTSISGITLKDALAYVREVVINSDRVTMSTVVSLSLKVNEPDYTAYASRVYKDVSYDPESSKSPAEQFYEYLMTQPEYAGGVQYP